LCLWLTGSLLTLLWIYGSHAFDWRLYLALTAVMLAGAVAYKGWKSAPVGQLIWDGQCWRWEGTGYLTGVAEQKLAWHACELEQGVVEFDVTGVTVLEKDYVWRVGQQLLEQIVRF